MIKRISILIAFVLLLSACTNVSPEEPVTPPEVTVATAEPSPSPDVAYSSLEELVSLMTLDEKVGQMTQVERQELLRGDVKRFFLGSVLSGGGSHPEDDTPEGWAEMVDGYMQQSLDTRLGIPIIYGIDAVHGHNNVTDATVFPHNVGLGAIGAGDIESGADIAERIGEATAEEMLATRIPWTFSPVLGVAYDTRWGRAYECFGENIELVSAMGPAVIRGLQKSGYVAACMKHYLGEGQTQNGQNQGNAIMTDGEIREILAPYIRSIEAGALTLMPSFSSINGVKMHESKELLTDVLKNELGFEGFIISDWAAVTQLTGGTYKQQLANAVNAGVDMIMAVNGREQWLDTIKYIKLNVIDETIPVERIDDAVLRILRVKEKLGLFEERAVESGGSVGGEENRALAMEAAERSMTLLKNENEVIERLPSFENILVAGQGGLDIGMQCGGWTFHWQGGHGDIMKGTTIVDGIKKLKSNVTYSPSGAAEGVFDCVIAVVGESPYAEMEGDRPGGAGLRVNDINMLNEVYKLGCPVIVVMLTGRPLLIQEHLGYWDALVSAWLPGTEGGDAVANVLFGGAGFTGRTPFTWKTAVRNGEILFEYGYGLNVGEGA